MLEEVKTKVYEILKKDKSAHGIDHALRVYNLAIKFAKEENANIEIVGLAALLHDVDDYKLVGIKNADKFLNAKKIMNEINLSQTNQEQVIDIIKNMDFSKYLKGIRPKTIEGMCVSDADMCVTLGATGIIRTITYQLSDKGNGVIFDKNIFPNLNITSKEYNSKITTHDTDGLLITVLKNY